MKWFLCVLTALALAYGAGASGPHSWEKAETVREDEEGWSRDVGGVRLQIGRAIRQADDTVVFTLYVHATPAARRRLVDDEMISLHLSDARGVEILKAGPVPFRFTRWVGGKVRLGWTWGGVPASVVFAHAEWKGRGLVTKKFRIRPAPR